MMSKDLYEMLADKSISREDIAEIVLANKCLIPRLIAGLDQKAPIKFGSDKVLCLVSQANPSLLYPYFDVFAANLHHRNKVLQWGASRILANLTLVDDENRFETIFSEYFQSICGPDMIAAANTINNAKLICTAKQHLAEPIIEAILKVKDAVYKTSECKKIVIGAAIETLDMLFDQTSDTEEIISFVVDHLNNTRPATAKKARAFMDHHDVRITA